MSVIRIALRFSFCALIAVTGMGISVAAAAAAPRSIAAVEVTRAVAMDVSRPVRSLPRVMGPMDNRILEVRDDDGPFVQPRAGYDPAVQHFAGTDLSGAPLMTFEGLTNSDNPSAVVPPDPNGAVGISNYVEIVNTVFGVYDKTGHLLAGPSTLGSLWSGFSVGSCAGNAGDPVVLYDRVNDRWLLSQFTSGPPYYNCVAISQTGDPAGAYYRYAFTSGSFFPDYPKYGDWSDSYILTSRDFGPNNAYGISVYGLEKKKMVAGNPNARMVHFFLDSSKVPTYTMGDGLLPADVDGKRHPAAGEPAPIVGTMNVLGPYSAPADALNIYDLTVVWSNPSASTLTGPTQIDVAPFNSTFPCGSAGRSCIPQPGTTNKIDFLGYRQRPTFRLAFRVFNGYETMVTNQSVQADTNRAGVRWYEIRRAGGVYSLYQQGTYAPADTVNRWMGSIAMDKHGDVGLGYSVSDAVSVFPGIRFTGRRPGDPLGTMTLREGTLRLGHGSQLVAQRWGDYTAMQVDPSDDCTFWYIDEYFGANSPFNWQTRIGTFKYRACK